MLEQRVYDSIRYRLEEYNKENWSDTIDRIYKEIGSAFNLSYHDTSTCIMLVIGEVLRIPLSWTFRRFITGYTKYNPLYSSHFGMDVNYFANYFIKLNNINIFAKWADDLIIKELNIECGGATEEQLILMVGMIQRLRCILNVSDLTDNINSYICDNILEQTETVFLEFIDPDDMEMLYDDLCVRIHRMECAVISGIFPENGNFNVKDVLMYISEQAEMFIDDIKDNITINVPDYHMVNRWIDKIEQILIETFIIVLDAACEKYDGVFYDTKEISEFMGTIIHTIWLLY